MIVVWRIIRGTSTEIKIIIATLMVFIFLPAITVVVVAASGIQLVGNALASLNPVTHLVEVFDTNGNKIGDLQLTTNWPTRGYISDEFGTFGAFREEMGLGRHTGIDIANSNGIIDEPITPFLEGTILRVDLIDNDACGINVKLQHSHNITSTYCHLSQAVNIPKDTPVKPGDVIGYMGSTGASTGAHLHFQINIYDIPVNPRIFMVGEPEASAHVIPTF
jgi:murein DD-endopeptidase MepM/ murein hydrolase activator NlpD